MVPRDRPPFWVNMLRLRGLIGVVQEHMADMKTLLPLGRPTMVLSDANTIRYLHTVKKCSKPL